VDNEKINTIALDCAVIKSQMMDLREYIVSVNTSVQGVRQDLASHKENTDAHGRRASEQTQSIIVAWLAVVVAGMVGVADYLRGHH